MNKKINYSKEIKISRSHESRDAVHDITTLINAALIRGNYHPFGATGKGLKHALFTLSPEIYGTLRDFKEVELGGLLYVFDRLPCGIEECQEFTFASAGEGAESGDFQILIPPKRRRESFRVGESMVFKITRGRSELYDTITHLTFLFIEAKKIFAKAYDKKMQKSPEWLQLEMDISHESHFSDEDQKSALWNLSRILSRTYEEVKTSYLDFQKQAKAGFNHGLLKIIYGLGEMVRSEYTSGKPRVSVFFTPTLKKQIDSHLHGSRWARQVKNEILTLKLHKRPIHIISANLHSVLNSLTAYASVKNKPINLIEMAFKAKETPHQNKTQGVYSFKDRSGTNIDFQIFDLAKMNLDHVHPDIKIDTKKIIQEKPVILVMDYAFGEQAYEVMDELLKPLKKGRQATHFHYVSLSVMGKAGILSGDKGDIMIPSHFIFEGTTHSYPIENEIEAKQFASGMKIFTGGMLTVAGTSLQNKEILSYFKKSTYRCIGLEMEGGHYARAVQIAKLRGHISEILELYAYYASDNPLKTGHTLASGSLGDLGIEPTYRITQVILEKIL